MKQEQILQTLHILLQTIPDVQIHRNIAIPIKIEAEGLLILRDGKAGSPDKPMGGVGNAYISHKVEIEIYVQEYDSAKRDEQFDNLTSHIIQLLEQNSSLSSQIFGMEYTYPSSHVEHMEGAIPIKNGVMEVEMEYEIINK